MTHYTDDAPVHYVDPINRRACRIKLEQDTDAASPRDNDGNLTIMATIDRHYVSPDHDDTHGRPTHSDAAARTDLLTILPSEYVNRDGFDTLDARYVNKWMALHSSSNDVLAWGYLERNQYDGTLDVIWPEHTGKRNTSAYNYVKQYHDGLVWITRARWIEEMGIDETGVIVRDWTPRQAIEAEIEEYNRWSRSEYVGWVVEVPEVWHTWGGSATHSGQRTQVKWVTEESVWNYDNPDYAWGEAMAHAGVTDEMECTREDVEALVIGWEAQRLVLTETPPMFDTYGSNVKIVGA